MEIHWKFVYFVALVNVPYCALLLFSVRLSLSCSSCRCLHSHRAAGIYSAVFVFLFSEFWLVSITFKIAGMPKLEVKQT